MRLSDLQNKNIINLVDGKNLGNIIDVNINDNGSINGLIVEKRRFLISFFSGKKDLIVKWDSIKKIGEDVILVNLEYQ